MSRTQSKLAGYIHEVRLVLSESDLTGLDVVDAERPFIAETEERVRAEGKKWLSASLESHNQTDLGYALQIFYSLHPTDLHSIIDLTLTRSLDSLITQIRKMTDVSSLTLHRSDQSRTRQAGHALHHLHVDVPLHSVGPGRHPPLHRPVPAHAGSNPRVSATEEEGSH